MNGYTVYTGKDERLKTAFKVFLDALGIGTAQIDPKDNGITGFRVGPDKRAVQGKYELAKPESYNGGYHRTALPHFDLTQFALRSAPVIVEEGGIIKTRHEVEFHTNGDVTVGCTTVPSATVDAIIEARKAITK